MSRQKARSLTQFCAQPTDKSIVLVGLMGAGKTCIGKRLADRLCMDFIDADVEIEIAANRTVPEIFAELGEQAFRDGEKRVIARLLSEQPRVIATGGGAFMDEETRSRTRNTAISIWLKADLNVLLQRVSRRNNRPLLQTDDQRKTLKNLIAHRHPFYSEADITVRSGNEPPDTTVQKVYEALRRFRHIRDTNAAAEQ